MSVAYSKEEIRKIKDECKNSDYEFEITEHKEEFPKFEDIEEFTGPEWFYPIAYPYIMFTDENTHKRKYKIYKIAYENGVDVTWKLKEKIDRRLHVNKELAQALGEWIILSDEYPTLINRGKLTGISRLNSENPFCRFATWENEAILSEEWSIPQSVIDRMNELKEQNKQD